MIYAGLVGLGTILALVAMRLVPPGDAIPDRVARWTRIAAIGGAILGAYLFELPADLFGWAPSVEPGHAIGGRTVLGGMLGGWLAVELTKWRLGYRGATGDRFALPLAVALACGRVGCTLTGCCPGRPIARDSILAPLSLVAHDPPRFPATLVEAWFHALAGVVIVIATLLGLARGRRLAIYLAVYAVVRFVLEAYRDDPVILLGLSYYQWLALPLFALAAITTIVRTFPHKVGTQLAGNVSE